MTYLAVQDLKQGGRLIFERDEDFCAGIVEHAVRRYLDIKPVLLRGARESFAA